MEEERKLLLFRFQGGLKLGPGRRETEIGKDQRRRDIDNGQQTKKRKGYLRGGKKEADVNNGCAEMNDKK